MSKRLWTARARTVTSTTAKAGSAAVWLLLVNAASALAQESSGQAADDVLESAQPVIRLLWVSLLLMVIFLGGLFILRSLRRSRQHLLRRPSKPTQWSDVWQEHRLPEDAAAEGEEDPS